MAMHPTQVHSDGPIMMFPFDLDPLQPNQLPIAKPSNTEVQQRLLKSDQPYGGLKQKSISHPA